LGMSEMVLNQDNKRLSDNGFRMMG
jgi:hypothetical protein